MSIDELEAEVLKLRPEGLRRVRVWLNDSSTVLRICRTR